METVRECLRCKKEIKTVEPHYTIWFDDWGAWRSAGQRLSKFSVNLSEWVVDKDYEWDDIYTEIAWFQHNIPRWSL